MQNRRSPEEANRFTRALAVVSLLVSLTGLAWSVTWSIWSTHRINVVNLAEKQTTAVAAITVANLAVHDSTALHMSVRLDITLVRPFVPCDIRKQLDDATQAAQAHEAKLRETQQRLNKMMKDLSETTSPEDVEKIRAMAIRYQAWAELETPEHGANLKEMQDMLRKFPMTGASPVTCPSV